jgi:hypothetical protein
VERDKRHIIHPQAILKPARAANLRPETILAMAQVIVTLHNDMLSVFMKGGFALLLLERQSLAGARRQLSIIQFW